eukprot:7404-Heterococcus_DN1.PRE.1
MDLVPTAVYGAVVVVHCVTALSNALEVVATLYYTLTLSYEEHSTILSACNPPKASGPVDWDAAAVKLDYSLPAVIRKHCKSSTDTASSTTSTTAAPTADAYLTALAIAAILATGHASAAATAAALSVLSATADGVLATDVQSQAAV